MFTFTSQLQREVDREISRIEANHPDILRKALAASHVLREAFARLKEFILSYRFRDAGEEITFFKDIKPRMFCRLVFYKKVYNIEIDRPVSGMEAQRTYLANELENIDRSFKHCVDFLRYYRSGATHLDSLYFLRGKTDGELYLETLCHEFDRDFSTTHDSMVTKILANEMLSGYLTNEIEKLKNPDSVQINNGSFPAIRLTWQGTKTDLYEQLYSWYCLKIFGDVSMSQLVSYFRSVFNIELDHNMSRTFSEMKIRNNPTPFLDRMKDALLKRMQRIVQSGRNKSRTRVIN